MQKMMVQKAASGCEFQKASPVHRRVISQNWGLDDSTSRRHRRRSSDKFGVASWQGRAKFAYIFFAFAFSVLPICIFSPLPPQLVPSCLNPAKREGFLHLQMVHDGCARPKQITLRKVELLKCCCGMCPFISNSAVLMASFFLSGH